MTEPLIKDVYGVSIPNFSKLNGDRDFICGCEYEIESIKGLGGADNIPGINIVEDNSLRNNGREFTTMPSKLEQQLDTFQQLHKTLSLGKDPFSERTSIHVHVNARELNVNEVRQMVLTYALLEPLFFEYVGPVRKGSIFCVPLNYTYLPSLYRLPTTQLRDRWHKYTAFNILPLNQFGTIEFRHMYGTGNVETMAFWLGALKELYMFIANRPEFDIINELQRGVKSTEIARQVVPSLAVQKEEELSILLADTLLDVKLSVGGLK